MKGLGELRMLIVDDRQESRAMLKNMLLEIGVAQVFETADGKEALQFLSDFDFVDIVLCDWNMPGMDGMALLHHLRRTDPSLPFMMVTGRGDITSVAAAKRAGVSGYLLKPYSLVRLEAKLRAVAGRAKKSPSDINITDITHLSSA
jgi:two-component system, chemotaxis family, chemotaxis protein CheY